jgi:PIN domain nuclease of toxin-antitoxin system
MASYLLDTNAILFIFGNAPKIFPGMNSLLEAANREEVLISPVSAWEIGMLANMVTGRSLGFSNDPVTWMKLLIQRARLQTLSLTIDAAILSSRLPGDFHKDPADRLLVASAIDAGATFVTRDAKILDWAAQTGAMKVLAC